ncbi:MAG: hypothetical protein ACMUHX_06080 [bacterium]
MSEHCNPYLLLPFQAISQNVPLVKVEGLKGPGIAIFLALLNKRFKKNILFITPTPNEAESFLSDLRFFSKDQQIYLYPTREILPYEELEPDPLLISQRIRGLQSLLYQESVVVVASVRAIMDKIMPKQTLGKATGYYGVGESVPRQKIVRELLEGGYQSVPLVEERGAFIGRGGDT